jgi:Ala-tRNA(Pro) deacylase
MVKSGSEHLMAVLPADHRIDLEKLEQITARTCSLENEKNFKSLFPDCAPGTMPPFGKLYGLPMYIDRSLSQPDYIVFEAGTHTDAIKLSYRDYERIAEPNIEDFAIRVQSIKPATS